MSALVIVITDLHAGRRGGLAARVADAPPGSLPGLGAVARFGDRAPLPGGWRGWLAGALGRPDLATWPAAHVALASLRAQQSEPEADGPVSHWIATPVHLLAGPGQIWLEHAGLLRLTLPQQQALAADFQGLFADGGRVLRALPGGSFLLTAPGLAALEVAEPARLAGGDVSTAVPRAAQYRALRRLNTEIEMWLHAQPAAHVRQGSAGPDVNALWLWGAAPQAAGVTAAPAPATGARAVEVFGHEAVADALAALAGRSVRELPVRPADLPGDSSGASNVLLLALADELRAPGPADLAAALARVDRDFVAPAVDLVRRGDIRTLTVMSMDDAAILRRPGLLKFWRRARRVPVGSA
ncbi:MAG: hypothetical protein JSR67_15845 [Proteobacteria bacterium]|nr:hypothetical protein [Pseudomonadota bacterium]